MKRKRTLTIILGLMITIVILTLTGCGSNIDKTEIKQNKKQAIDACIENEGVPIIVLDEMVNCKFKEE